MLVNTPWKRERYRLQNRLEEQKRHLANAENDTKKAWAAWKAAAIHEQRMRDQLGQDEVALQAHERSKP